MSDILLKQLADIHKTDKGWRGYLSTYDKYFSPIRDQSLKILEIGIYKGGSLKMWKEYFPKSIIFGIDINNNSIFNENRIICKQANQGSRKDLQFVVNEIGDNIDIIIDDGSHIMNHQQISLGFLFPFLKPNGFYVIEDIHTSFFEKGYGINTERSNTTYWLLKNYQNKISIESQYMTKEENIYLKHNIESCYVYEKYEQSHRDNRNKTITAHIMGIISKNSNKSYSNKLYGNKSFKKL